MGDGDPSVPNILWDPDDRKPRNAADIEAEIQKIAPGAQVRLTLQDGEWLVRALAPAAWCYHGVDYSARDVSAAIAELLGDHDHPARVFRRR
jgi:hypothetical protein